MAAVFMACMSEMTMVQRMYPRNMVYVADCRVDVLGKMEKKNMSCLNSSPHLEKFGG
jgi:hypothetical protein